MSQTNLPTFIEFLFELKECTPPDDWACSICMEEAPDEQGDRILEVTDCPVQLSCGHIFDLNCVYTLTAGDQLREGLDAQTRCPLCRAELFEGYSDDDRHIELIRAQMSEFHPIFFETHLENHAASVFLTRVLQECIDRAPDMPDTLDWITVTNDLVDSVTDSQGGLVGHLSIVDGEVVPFMCDGHRQHRQLWLQISLALLVFRVGHDDNWRRTERWMQFEQYFLQIGDEFRARQALLEQPATEGVVAAIARFVGSLGGPAMNNQ